MADFSENIVNLRFKMVFDALERSKKIKGKSDIGKKLGTYNHIVNDVLNGRRNLTIEQLDKLFAFYKINPRYMFGVSEEMFDGEAAAEKTALRSRAITDMNSFEGRQNISLVPYKAQAGYALNAGSPEVLENTPKFSLPGVEGQLIAFEISGDSMFPTIASGDMVVCEILERGEPIRDSAVYVVVTDVVVAKRIQQIKEGAELRQLNLISDNKVFSPYTVDLDEVRQILKVKYRITQHGIS